MKHDDAAAVVLVRAAEEVLPQTIPPDKLLDAHIAAGDPAEGAPWLARRARYLIANCLGPCTEMLPRLERRSSGWAFIALAAFAGLAANYLGPSTRIHVVWNPMMILIAWNFLVYTVLLISAAFSSPAEMPDPESSASPRQYRGFNSRIYRPGVVERIIFGPALSWLFAVKARVDEMRQDVVGFRKVAQRFAGLWWPLARPILHLWFRRTLHLSAIGIAVGAIIGMYVRGLFFDYNVIWQSTFVKDPESVAIILRYLLGPAAIVRGQPLPTADSVAPLFTPEGDDADSWIHLYAVSALLFIVIPRGFLALATTRQLSGQHRNVRLDLEVGYYAEVLERARNVRPKELEARVRGAVRDECLGVSHDFAEFVCRELYDARIAPRIVKFRETGGTLRALENELRLECQSFGAELHAQMAKAGQELERRVAV
jgi:Protein of unknown function (DUF2868)